MTNNEFRKRLRRRLMQKYKALYYGYWVCAPALHLKRHLPGRSHRRILLAKIDSSYVAYHLIPKAGSTTIKSLLLDAIGYPLPTSDDVEVIHRISVPLVIPENSDNYLKRIKESFLQKPPELERAFHFTFVKNPWARLVSCYINKILGKRPGRFSGFRNFYPRIRFEQMTFTDFVRFAYRVPDDLCEPHFRPQCNLIDWGGTIDFIGHTERFTDDLAEVIKRAGLDKRLLKWGHTKLNKTQKDTSHYTDFYTRQTRKWVAQKYAKDIERFGYRFGD